MCAARLHANQIVRNPDLRSVKKIIIIKHLVNRLLNRGVSNLSTQIALGIDVLDLDKARAKIDINRIQPLKYIKSNQRCYP